MHEHFSQVVLLQRSARNRCCRHHSKNQMVIFANELVIREEL
jgi:hypothetical protein